MGNNQIAFFIGLLGSVHCVGMCGPLAFSIPSNQKMWWLLLIDKLLYNFGRVITYTCFGLLLGYTGKLLWLAGSQQIVSILSGMFVLVLGLIRLFKWKGTGGIVGFPLFYKLINYAIKHKAGHLLIGMLNGFLPCGFVYVALFSALNTTSPADAALFMFWFGLGTFPLMLAATFSFGFISTAIRRKINIAMPYLLVCLGFWFILRGSGLNIHYLSPAVKQVGVGVCR